MVSIYINTSIICMSLFLYEHLDGHGELRVRIFGEHTNFEPNLKWDPHIIFNGSKLFCDLLYEKKKKKHLFTQIHRDLNKIMAFKIGTVGMNNGWN